MRRYEVTEGEIRQALETARSLCATAREADRIAIKPSVVLTPLLAALDECREAMDRAYDALTEASGESTGAARELRLALNRIRW